jgi:hypothetical protein
MRLTLPLLALGFALATAGSALAASPDATGSMTTPDTSTPSSQPGGAMPSDQTAARPSDQPSAPAATPGPSAQPPANAASAGATGANTSATAPANFQVGQQVQDNTGATIGSISSLTTAGGQQMAVINMNGQSFQVPTNRLGVNNGAAEINLTQAQIAAMLKGPAASH